MINYKRKAMATLNILIRNKYFQAYLILVIMLIFAKVFHYIIKNYLKKITERTKGEIDNTVIRIITKPLYLLIIFVGVFFALRSLSFFDKYISWINNIFFVLFVLLTSFLLSRILSLFVAKWLRVQKRFEKTP